MTAAREVNAVIEQWLGLASRVSQGAAQNVKAALRPPVVADNAAVTKSLEVDVRTTLAHEAAAREVDAVIDEWLGLASRVPGAGCGGHSCIERHSNGPPQYLVEPAREGGHLDDPGIGSLPAVLPSPASTAGMEPTTGAAGVLSFQPGDLGELLPSLDLGSSARSGLFAGNTSDCITRPATAGSGGSMLPPSLPTSLQEPIDEDMASMVPPLDLALDFVMGFEEVIDTEGVREHQHVSGADAASETGSIAVSDLVEMKQAEMQVQNWPRIGSRLCHNLITASDRPPMFPKTPWSDPTMTAASSEFHQQKLSAEWLRDRWNQLRKPEISRPSSRLSGSCCETPGRSMRDLTSLDAFNKKLTELHWSAGEGPMPPLATWTVARDDEMQCQVHASPCVIPDPAAEISTFGPSDLPPPPNFDPPEFRSLCLQQDARA